MLGHCKGYSHCSSQEVEGHGYDVFFWVFTDVHICFVILAGQNFRRGILNWLVVVC